MSINTKNKKEIVKGEARADKTGANWTKLGNGKYQKNVVKMRGGQL